MQYLMRDEVSDDIDLLRPGRDFDAVVIGASAGALETLQALVPHLRCHSTAFILVVHLSAAASAEYPAQFTGLAHLPLRMARHGETVQPGVIYFAPAGRHLMVAHDERFELVEGPLVNYARPAIDILFESAADTWGRRTVGVILTGSNADGAQGLKAIGVAGGLTLVQDPAGATAPYMPSVAIRTAHPAAVLSLKAMAQLLDVWAREETERPPPESLNARRNDAA